MKAREFHCINADNQTIEKILVPISNAKREREIAHGKLKFRFPNTYYFIELRRMGEIELPIPS